MLQVLDAAAIRRWADLSVDLMDAHRAELDRTNVFPVADADTGTNLALTLRAAAEALGRAPATCSAAEAAAVLASGALRGARGNSGVIVSQLPRGLAEVLAGAATNPGGNGGVDGPGLACALRRADQLARAAVSRPVEGTVLSVLSAAAAAAEVAAAEPGAGLGAVVAAAEAGSADALALTPRQLPVLARAGVVDAGGRGLALLLGALAEVVTGQRSDRAGNGVDYHPRDPGSLVAEREAGSAEYEYEVMYLLEASTAERVTELRRRLDELGDSVALVGDGAPDGAGTWHVHVHCGDVGAAIEVGVDAGRPRRITVVRFADQVAGLGGGRDADRARFTRERAVVTVVTAAAVADLVRADGVVALVAGPERPPAPGELAAAMAGTRARHVVVLPNDAELTPAAEEAADLVRTSGAEVVVVPTSSVLQGLAALAVHDASRRAGDDVVAMAEAAAATRTGVVQVAVAEALTWVGRCRAGDVLGLVDGEVVLIEQDLDTVAIQLVDRMLTTGGELVTVLLAEAGGGELGDLLTDHLRRTHPEVEVAVYRGGPTDRPLQLGVE